MFYLTSTFTVKGHPKATKSNNFSDGSMVKENTMANKPISVNQAYHYVI